MTAAGPTLVPTGIEALDSFLHGGLPRGFFTLVLAPSGSGAEMFAKQFAAGSPAEKTTYLTTDESIGEVMDTAKACGWDFSHVGVMDLQSEFADAMMALQEKNRGKDRAGRRYLDPRELVEATHSRDLLPTQKEAGMAPGYLQRLFEPYADPAMAGRLVVHSLDFFLNLHSVDDVVAALTALKATNARRGGLVMAVLAKGAHGPTVERRLELLADCLIELEVTRKGTTFERFFMVRKVKNRSHGIGVSTYEVTPTGFLLETLERIV